MFDGCSHKTNIYSSFRTNKWRKHQSCTVNDFKSGIIVTSSLSSNPSDLLNSDLNELVQLDEPTTEESRDFEKEFELKFFTFTSIGTYILSLQYSCQRIAWGATTSYWNCLCATFIESFSSGHVCWLCTASKSEIQTKQVESGSFTSRTEDLHSDHLKTIEEQSLNNFCGVKRRCVLSEKLSHFKVTTGFPLDLVHELFEGIVPAEIALCLSIFTSKKYFTFAYLNESILHFPFKWTDK